MPSHQILPISDGIPAAGEIAGSKNLGLSTVDFSSRVSNFHAGYFRISLSLAGQALLWKTLLRRRLISALHPSAAVVDVVWWLALVALVCLSIAYLLKCAICFKTVKSEFLHRVGVNYLYVPWISCLLLLQSAPFLVPRTTPYVVLWWAFAVPVVALDVKIYGQWFTKGKQFLSSVANPSSQLSVIGNLVGAHAAADMGWKETATCLFALGIVHYLVLFITLYQRFSGSEILPAMLRPVFFLYFAAPSVASLSWQSISGGFDVTSKMLFFLSLFLFTSLICRPLLFKRSMRKFNIAWWAYSFPLTVLALASTEYAQVVNGVIPHTLMILLFILSVVVVVSLTALTLLNTKMLFSENDPVASFLVNNLSTASLWT